MTTFRERIRQGDTLLGQMVLELFSPGIGPMLAACGLDFVIFDMEHGRCDLTLLAEMVASTRGSDIFPSHEFQTWPMRLCRVLWTLASGASWCPE